MENSAAITPKAVREDATLQHELMRNEVFFPALPGVKDAVEQALNEVHKHGDIFAAGLSARIAAEINVPAEHVVVGAGSAALLQELIRTQAGPGEEVVLAWPSFEAYPAMVANVGATPVRVRLSDHRHDLDAMAAAVTDRTRLMLICNPNNPTGTVLGHDELDRLLRALPSHVTVAVDEAYHEFADPVELAEGLELHKEDDRVCVVRTFSKAYGLLGSRVGYLVGHPPLIRVLSRTLPFFRANALGQAAALAALDAADEMRRRCAVIVAERNRIRSVLGDIGLLTPDSGGNFLWLPLGEEAEAFARFCTDRGVRVWGLPGEGVRVTIGDRSACDAFVAAAAEYPGIGAQS
ncbi:aminotransferase class I/II-fold pyridoxal phosphate-dependent enzyme [Amycolatopsis sp. cg5]|uniref:aminotransferase class I/II-fold pyridoxal phosphate-dependent enzyme n=1 Tax=Amycolatopsis sp. cg5 TaxID=3238802 RepID=UPI0035263567